MVGQKEIKLQHYCHHVLKALCYYFKSNNANEARQWFRMSAEAYMKYRLYDALDKSLVADYLSGSKKINGDMRRKPHRPAYSDMHNDLQSVVSLTDEEDKALDALSFYANVGAHDSDEEPSPVQDRVGLDMLRAESQKLTYDFYKLLGQEIPQEIDDAYQGNVDESVLQDYLDFSDVLEACDGFNKGNRYILISPADNERTSINQKQLLARAPWSFILDFDPATKGRNGLFTAFGGVSDSRIVPMTIEQYKGNTLAVSNSKGRLNWLFANGLDSMEGTVTADFRSWIHLKYDKFIKTALHSFVKDIVNTYYIVCLSDNAQYIKSIVHSLHDIDELQPDLVHFILVSPNEEALVGLADEVEGYGFDYHPFHMDCNLFLMGIEETLSGEGSPAQSSVVVPAKAEDGSMSTVDIATIAPRLSDGGIEAVHSAIGASDETEKKPAETFFRGETVTWHELSQEVEASRKVYDQIVRKVRKKLAARQSSVFRLYHAAGAGGSTLSLRLAYDMRKDSPVVILHTYVKGVTEEMLQLLYNRVKTPVLVIVEASEVSISTVESLVRDCNSNKQNFLFFFVQRNAKVNPSDDTEYLNDTMLDTDEKNRFLGKVNSYGRNKDLADDLKKRATNNCEVIDFSIAISEDKYEVKKIEDYVSYYTKKLSAPLLEFVRYVCMIHHYSQKSVSDVVFRSLFTKDGKTVMLSKYLSTREKHEIQALRKLLVSTEDETDNDGMWRPRYASFGKAVLDTVSTHGWKSILYNVSLNLIKRIRENQEFLTDDVRKMLVSVFLERGTGDLLGVEEEWKSRTSNTQFSVLLEELGGSEICQSNVLKRLANSYPNEPHFWGHLARFTYEKANKPADFDEAMGYIQRAFDANGESDFNLQHIAGMCKRRKLEYYKRENKKLDLQEIKELVEDARDYFARSRQLNSKNVYAYISEIQLIAILIEYGKKLSQHTSYRDFLFAANNSWYQEQYVCMLELLGEARLLLRQMKTLGDTGKTRTSFHYLHESESRSILFRDDIKGMLGYLSQLVDGATQEERPRLRHMYVWYLLLSKVNCEPSRIDEAWSQLTETECEKVSLYLDRNIMEKNTDVFSLRYWFMFVRKCRPEEPVEEVLSRLEMLKREASAHPLLYQEACYNIAILKSFLIIQDEDYFETEKVKEIRELNNICHQASVNDKFIYDVLVHCRDLSGIVPYKRGMEIDSCHTFRGVITNIASPTQGEIKIKCGLTAFFVPSKGDFVSARDESKEVTFCIGFRHDGLIALQVRLADQAEPPATNLADELAAENYLSAEDFDSPAAAARKYDGRIASTKQKFTPLGKIDLDAVPKR